MNTFQKKIAARALAAIDSNKGRKNQFLAKDREFLADIDARPDDYVLSEKQNSWLNDISQRLRL